MSSEDQYQTRAPHGWVDSSFLTGPNAAGKKESEKQEKVLAFDEFDTKSSLGVWDCQCLRTFPALAQPSPLAQGDGAQHQKRGPHAPHAFRGKPMVKTGWSQVMLDTAQALYWLWVVPQHSCLLPNPPSPTHSNVAQWISIHSFIPLSSQQLITRCWETEINCDSPTQPLYRLYNLVGKSSFFTIFVGGFLSVCFIVIAFNLKRREERGPFPNGTAFYSPSGFQSQNQYFRINENKTSIGDYDMNNNTFPAPNPLEPAGVAARQSPGCAPEEGGGLPAKPPCCVLRDSKCTGRECRRRRHTLAFTSTEWSHGKRILYNKQGRGGGSKG